MVLTFVQKQIRGAEKKKRENEMKYKKTGNLKNSNYIQKNSFLIGNHHKINQKQKQICNFNTKHVQHKPTAPKQRQT